MIHTVRNEYLTVSASLMGAELMSIQDAHGTEYLWQGDSRYWSDRAPNIFPYVGRLTQGSYLLDDQRYQMNIHGIAPYRRFVLAEKTETKMVFTLTADDEIRRQYPREFAFSVIYSLEGKTLSVCFRVENRDEKSMYFGLGGHPGFNVPLVPGKTFEDYRLRFSPDCSPRRVLFTDDCFVSGQTAPFPLENGSTLPLRHQMFDDDAIVLTEVSHQVTLEADGCAGITVTYPQMDYIGFWHWPKTDAPYICIEPWCSLPASHGKTAVLEEQADLIRLAPGNLYENTWTITLNT